MIKIIKEGGIHLGRFKDSLDQGCVMREGKDGCLWLGVERGYDGEKVPAPMNLNREQLFDIMKLMLNFAKHGNLPGRPQIKETKMEETGPVTDSTSTTAFDRMVPNQDQVKNMTDVTEAISNAHNVVETNCGNSRYSSLAKTALEEANMWATKSITHN